MNFILKVCKECGEIEIVDDPNDLLYCPKCGASYPDKEETEAEKASKDKVEITTDDPGFVIKGSLLVDYNGNKEDLVIPGGITVIGSNFAHNKKISTVTIPDSVKIIESRAFKFCNDLTCVVIPDSVTTIERQAFSNCKNLTGVVIGKGVTSIEEGAFTGCSSLNSIVCNAERYSVVNDCLIEDGTKLLVGTSHSTIPDGITTICKYAFSGIKELTEINVPDSVTSINMCAFSRCPALKAVTLGNGVTHIGVSAFSGCESLKSIVIPDNVEFIDYHAFQDCKNLSSIVIGSGVNKINARPFEGCNVDEVVCRSDNYRVEGGCLIEGARVALGTNTSVIPEGINRISDSAFSGRRNLAEIKIPDGVTFIGDKAFYDSNITEIVIPDSVEFIGNQAFAFCDKLQSVRLSDNVTSFGNYAFIHCHSLTDITIPKSVTHISDSAFDGCRNLKRVTIHNGPEEIEDHAFFCCRSLTDVYIPDSVEVISDSAFDGCSNLTMHVTCPEKMKYWSEKLCSDKYSISIVCDYDQAAFA